MLHNKLQFAGFTGENSRHLEPVANIPNTNSSKTNKTNPQCNSDPSLTPTNSTDQWKVAKPKTFLLQVKEKN